MRILKYAISSKVLVISKGFYWLHKVNFYSLKLFGNKESQTFKISLDWEANLRICLIVSHYRGRTDSY